MKKVSKRINKNIKIKLQGNSTQKTALIFKKVKTFIVWAYQPLEFIKTL